MPSRFAYAACQGACVVLLLTSLVIAIYYGVGYIQNRVVVEQDCGNFSIGEEYRTGDNYVGVYFASCPTNAQFEAFTQAADKWSAVITENKISPVDIGFFSVTAKSSCNFLENNFQFESETVFDHLALIVDIVTIDSTGGTLAQTSVCRTDDKGDFPLVSGMLFDRNDLFLYESKGKMLTLIMHEMGHALGFGLSWSKEGLLKDPIFSGSDVNVNNVPKFVGESALNEFNDLLPSGQQDSDYVPVEDGRVDGKFSYFHPDQSSSSGKGSIDVHWKIETFGDELMVFAFSSNKNRVYPMSSVTIASLEDLGYSVDYTQAEDFTLKDPTAFRSFRGFSNDLFSDEIKLSDIAPDVEITPLSAILK